VAQGGVELRAQDCPQPELWAREGWDGRPQKHVLCVECVKFRIHSRSRTKRGDCVDSHAPWLCGCSNDWPSLKPHHSYITLEDACRPHRLAVANCSPLCGHKHAKKNPPGFEDAGIRRGLLVLAKTPTDQSKLNPAGKQLHALVSKSRIRAR
jgi:hypothetical protein